MCVRHSIKTAQCARLPRRVRSDAEHSDLTGVELDPLGLSALHPGGLEVDAERSAALGEDLLGDGLVAALTAEQKVDGHGPEGGRVGVRAVLHEAALLGTELQGVWLRGVLNFLQLDQREAGLHKHERVERRKSDTACGSQNICARLFNVFVLTSLVHAVIIFSTSLPLTLLSTAHRSSVSALPYWNCFMYSTSPRRKSSEPRKTSKVRITTQPLA